MYRDGKVPFVNSGGHDPNPSSLRGRLVDQVLQDMGLVCCADWLPLDSKVVSYILAYLLYKKCLLVLVVHVAAAQAVVKTY